jgi:RHS repeat-associated protein
MIYENNVLKQILVDGGYITFSGTAPYYHYYLQDHLGNNRVVVSPAGTAEQINHYYLFGGLFGESTGNTVQRFRYNGKEFDRTHGVDWYDYGARHMTPDAGRFTTIDPMAEKYYDISPYAYCANNPINSIDPDGKSTKVILLENGTYKVIGGDIEDNDRNIYLYSQDSNGDNIKGKSIGVSATMTSFYDSDNEDPSQRWSGIIDPNDNRGKQFLNAITGKNSPSLFKYMFYARNGKKYDFKVTNGTDSEIKGIDIYRGMPITTNFDGTVTYASARDVGNMAAGYIAAKNGIPWQAARDAFDFYQGSPEGISSVSAQIYGYTVLGYNTSAQKLLRILRK